MIEEVERRSEMISNSVLYATDTVSSQGALHRYVSSIGAQPEVSAVFVAAGEPLRVIACSEHKWLGALVSDLDNAILRDALLGAKKTREKEFNVLKGREFAVYSEPVSLGHLLSDDPLNGSGSAVLLFGLDYFKGQVLDNYFFSLASLFVVLLILTFGAYIVLGHCIHMPISKIIDSVNEFGKGRFMSVSDDLANDDIGRLAKVLEDSMLKELDSSRQAKYFARNLKFQKDALDQHAIVSETDYRGRITYVNNQFCEISGFSKEELKGKNHRIINSGYHPKSFFMNMYAELAQNGFWQGETRNRAKDGSFYWVNNTVVAFRSDDGKIERFVSIRTDVTQRKRTELELQKASSDIRKSFESENAARLLAEESTLAKSQFLATMSHEIRTPMNGLIGVLHLLEDGLPNDKVNLLRTAKNSADDLLILINDILDFSKIEAGKMTIESVPLDPLELIEDICDIHSSTAFEKGLDLIFAPAARDRYAVKGDPHRLRQIISNLIGNAVKFTGKGAIVVKIQFVEKDDCSQSLRVAVVDSGIGIEEETVAMLFDSFSQANSSTTRKFGGTGLGLAICKKLVELMGGTIGVNSKIGEGSEFWFEIPQGDEVTDATAKDDRIQLIDKTVLYVGPDDVRRRVVCDWLKYWGVEVSTLDSVEGGADEAIHASKGGCDVVLVDNIECFQKCAEIDGKLAQDSMLSSARRVYFKSFIEDHKTLNEHGLEFLAKPVRLSALLDVVSDGLYSNSEYRSESVSRVSFNDLKVLLVDDNSINRMIACSLLEQRHQITADTAVNGNDALEALRKSDYDFVFMDCMMPVMDGYTATSEIRRGVAGERHKDIPVIALTANAMAGERDDCVEAGMTDYLSKPIEPEAIAEVLGRWAGRRHQKVDILSQSSTAESEADLTILDLGNLSLLYDGEVSEISEMLSFFVSDLEKTLTQLKSAIVDTGDLERIQFFAHRIKGSCGEFGAARLLKVTSQAEDFARSDKLDKILEEKLMEKIEEEFLALNRVASSIGFGV